MNPRLDGCAKRFWPRADRVLGNPTATTSSASAAPPVESLSDAALIKRGLQRVTVYFDALHLAIVAEGDDGAPIRIALGSHAEPQAPGHHHPAGIGSHRPAIDKVDDRSRILGAIARSRAWVADLIACRVAGTEAIAARNDCSERAVRMVLPLAHLSPRIVGANVDHRLPRGIGVSTWPRCPHPGPSRNGSSGSE